MIAPAGSGLDDASSIEMFQNERGRLRGLAYRMTGTPDDADDIVQETWLRWQGADRSTIRNPAAWLTTVATRIAVDRLTSARARRELYVGPWLPEPITDLLDDPLEHTTSADTLSLGFLRVLETLTPVERAVFLLHDVFDVPFAEIAANVGREEAATRQIAHRARERVRDGRPRIDPRPAEVRALSDAFIGAALDGDLDRLASMLTEDVLHISDGGADHHAARRPIVGRRQVSMLFVNLARREFCDGDEFQWIEVNGQLAGYAQRAGQPLSLQVYSWRGSQVAEALAIVNPDKLRQIGRR